MLLTPFSATSDDEKSKAFVDAYEAANKDEVPNQFAADAYDVSMLCSLQQTMQELHRICPTKISAQQCLHPC